jgi:hypothetical protein
MVSAMGDATSEGDTTLQRTPCAASLASVSTIVSKAALDALYGPLPQLAVRAASELMATLLAASARARSETACQIATNPSVFTCHNCSNSASSVSTTERLVEPMPTA